MTLKSWSESVEAVSCKIQALCAASGCSAQASVDLRRKSSLNSQASMTDLNTRFGLQNTRKHPKPVCGMIPRYRDAHLGSSGATKDGSCPGLRRPTPRFDLTLNLTATAPLISSTALVLLLDLSRHSEAQVLVPKQTRAKDKIMNS